MLQFPHNRSIGEGRVFVIAEAGINHNGDLQRALAMVDAAAIAGADAVKFQTFRTELLVTPDAPKAAYQAENTGSGTQFDMLKAVELSREDHVALMRRCDERGILFMSTPFEETSADLLDDLGVPVFKLPSGEITNLPFLAHVARKGRPVILSTGMADMGEVEAALRCIAAAGDPPVVVLHCLSNYPADPAQANLRAMATLRNAFGRPVGYSDHTPGVAVALAAAALGAVVVEKHFTLDLSLPGPDHKASLEPEELRDMVAGIRTVTASLGDGIKRCQPDEAATIAVARKSLAAAVPLAKGTVIAAEHITMRRPATGIAPAMRDAVIGRVVRQDIAAGALLTWQVLA